MKNTLIITILIVLNLSVLGQHNFGLKLNGGISRLSSNLVGTNATSKIRSAPSGLGGAFYNYELGEKSILGVELLFSHIQSKETMSFSLINSDGVNVGYTTSDIYRNISYLSLPIYYGFKKNRFTFNAGFRVSYALKTGGSQKGETVLNGRTEQIDYEYDELNIDDFDFGARAGLTYNLTDKIDLEATYYYGTNNILTNNNNNWTWRIQQATIGVKYTLFSKEKNIN